MSMRCYWEGVALVLDIRQDLWLSGRRPEMGWNRGGGLRQRPFVDPVCFIVSKTCKAVLLFLLMAACPIAVMIAMDS